MRVHHENGTKKSKATHRFEDLFDDNLKPSKVERKSEKKRSKQRFEQKIRHGDWDFEDEDELY